MLLEEGADLEPLRAAEGVDQKGQRGERRRGPGEGGSIITIMYIMSSVDSIAIINTIVNIDIIILYIYIYTHSHMCIYIYIYV